MKFNPTKLTADLTFANRDACEAVENIDDGGSANLDSVFLRIPRVKETTVLDAIKKAGLYCRRKSDWMGKGYMITPTCAGQGNKRSKAVEVMADSLKVYGNWDVLTYQRMD